MRSRDLYKTDLERRLYVAGSEGPEVGRRRGGWRWVASLLGAVGGLGLGYWLYRRARERGDRPPSERSPEFPEDDGSELAA